jgi:hypothetical protein
MSHAVRSTSDPLETDPAMASRELTLIVAATSKMGIGRGGTLPWTGLKKEMAYFARVTKRAGPGVCAPSRCGLVISNSFSGGERGDYGAQNLGEHTAEIQAPEGQNECHYYTGLCIGYPGRRYRWVCRWSHGRGRAFRGRAGIHHWRVADIPGRTGEDGGEEDTAYEDRERFRV